MNFRDLEYVIALAETRSFSKASEKCFVSQPALSMQVKKLEDDLNAKLFERHQKSVLVTPLGMVIVEKAKQALQIRRDIELLAQQSNQATSLHVRMGIFPTMAQYLLPAIIQASLKCHNPSINIIPVEQKTVKLKAMIKQGDLDFAILAKPSQLDPMMAFEPMFTDPFMLAVYEGHPLAEKKSVSLQDLAKEKMLLLEEGHCLREQILELQIDQKHVVEDQITSIETLRQMVIARLGVTVIPYIATQGTQFEGIRYIPFTGEKLYRTIGLYYRTSSPLVAQIELIQSLIKSAYPDQDTKA